MSRRMYPMSAQKVKLIKKPITHTANAINILLIFLPVGVSCKTVEIASTIEKAESIPSVNRVTNNRRFQKLDPGISAAAVGKATYASPKDATWLDTGFPLSLKYPTIQNTVKPDMKLIAELEREIIKLSTITGLSLGL